MRPCLEQLESRESPSALAIDMVYVGGNVGSANALVASSPYASIAWTGSVASVNDIPGDLANGTIPWQGGNTMLCVVGGPDAVGQHTTYRDILRSGNGAVVEAVDPAGVSPEGLLWEIAQTARGNIYQDRGSSLSNIPQGPDSIQAIDHVFSQGPAGLTQQELLFFLFLFYEWEQQ